RRAARGAPPEPRGLLRFAPFPGPAKHNNKVDRRPAPSLPLPSMDPGSQTGRFPLLHAGAQHLLRLYAGARAALVLPPHDLLRDRVYRRLWVSILISSFGGQITMLALPLTAAVLLQATPTQMGVLTAMEVVPFVLFSLPAGVWLDRVRKLPVYVVGEWAIAVAVCSVPIA